MRRTKAELAEAAGQVDPERGEDQWISKPAAAAYLGLAEWQFNYLVRKGKILPAEMDSFIHRKYGNRRSHDRFSLAEVRAYAEGRRNNPATKWLKEVPPRVAADLLGLEMFQLQRKLQAGELKDLKPATVRKYVIKSCMEAVLDRLIKVGLGDLAMEALNGGKKEVDGGRDEQRRDGESGPGSIPQEVHPLH